MSALINIVTFNVRQPEDPAYCTDRVVQLLNSITNEADVICLQGLNPDRFRTITSALPHFIGFLSSGGAAIAVRKSAFPNPYFRESEGAAVLVLPGGNVYSVNLNDELVVEEGPGVILGSLHRDLTEEGWKDGMKKVGNFELSRPANNSPFWNRVWIRDVKPVSGDVLDFGLWSFKDDAERVTQCIDLCGSTHFPMKFSVRM